MEEFAVRMILAISNEDVGDWINILVIVLLAAFWALWGVLKKKAKKNEEDDEERDWNKEHSESSK